MKWIHIPALSLLMAAHPLVVQAGETWTGGHAGLLLGAARSEATATASLGGNWSVESPSLRAAVTGGLSGDTSADGIVAGVLAGYDTQLDNGLVIGIEVEVGDMGADETDTRRATSGSLSYTIRQGVELGTTYALRPRLGYALDNAQLYATLGWASTEVDAHTSLREAGNGYHKAGSVSDNLEQWLWGLGAEFRLTTAWSARLEFLHYEGDDVAYGLGYMPGSTFPGYTERVTQDIETDVLRAGASYRF